MFLLYLLRSIMCYEQKKYAEITFLYSVIGICFLLFLCYQLDSANCGVMVRGKAPAGMLGQHPRKLCGFSLYQKEAA